MCAWHFVLPGVFVWHLDDRDVYTWRLELHMIELFLLHKGYEMSAVCEVANLVTSALGYFYVCAVGGKIPASSSPALQVQRFLSRPHCMGALHAGEAAHGGKPCGSS